jgi:hypothetical protein
MLPKSWEPVPAGGMVLVGPKEDGGYVVVEKALKPVTLLVSMGLNDDWRFEEEFHRRTGASVICFDGSVDHRFWILHFIKSTLQLRLKRMFHYFSYRRFFSRPNIRHERKMIGHDGPGSISLASILAEVPDKHIFLKIDIEGSEYRILDDIVRHSDRVTGIVIEFHNVDLHRERIDRFVAGLPEFAVTALHPNNWGGVDSNGDPVVLEMSLMRREYVTPPAPGEERIEMPQNNKALPAVVAQYG